MTLPPEILKNIDMMFGPGVGTVVAVILYLIYRVLKGLGPKVIDLIVQIKLLREELEDLKKLPPKVEKIKHDQDQAFQKIRSLEEKLK